MGIVGEGTRDTELIAGIEGGEMLPALLMGAGALVGGIYSVGQAVENNRYWNDYYRNTGFRPRYPFRAGQYDWMQSVGASLTDFGLVYGYNRKAYRRYSYRRYYR